MGRSFTRNVLEPLGGGKVGVMRGWFAMVALCVGCGGASSATRPPALTAEDVELFDHAVDFIESPAMLHDDWGGNTLARLQRRIERADVIAVVRIPAVNTNIDLDRRRAYHLNVNVQKKLRGNAPRDLALGVHENQRGFASVTSAEERVMSEPFLLFLKWGWDAETEERQPHWHLSLASEQMQRAVSDALEHASKKKDAPAPQND